MALSRSTPVMAYPLFFQARSTTPSRLPRLPSETMVITAARRVTAPVSRPSIVCESHPLPDDASCTHANVGCTDESVSNTIASAFFAAVCKLSPLIEPLPFESRSLSQPETPPINTATTTHRSHFTDTPGSRPFPRTRRQFSQ